MPNSEPSKKTTQEQHMAEQRRLMDAHPRFTYREPNEGKTTVTFLNKKQVAGHKKQRKKQKK